MRVIAINSSARKSGNTCDLLKRVLEPLEAGGVSCEIMHIGGGILRGCTGCGACAARMDERCVFDDDMLNDAVQRMKVADGIILGAPTYFADVPAEMKAFIDRAGNVVRANGNMIARKAGASVVAVRRGGAIHAFDTMNHFFQISGSYIVSSSYWNIGIGSHPGDVLKDEEGMRTMRTLGENMLWLLKRIGNG